MKKLEETEQYMFDGGYEGMIVRRPDAPYKFNRATNREGFLMKVKRYMSAEAIVTGVNQKFHNANVAQVNELGLTSRSSSKENKIPLEQVGSFVVRDIKDGWVFEVHGFSHADAELWWSQRDDLIGKTISYKYLPIGMKDVPRHPIFKGFRDPIDL
jgi:DNA ligase-1